MKKTKEAAPSRKPCQPKVRVRRAFPVWVLPLLYSIAFAAMAWYFLFVRNADTMFFMQDRGWWNGTRLFFDDCMVRPGGLLAWTGAYLTQWFYHPALGTTLLILLWLTIFWLAKLIFRIPAAWSFLLLIPLTALLCSEIQLGYWVYILRDVDYVFYHSLGLLAALLMAAPTRLMQGRDGIPFLAAEAGLIVLVAALGYWPFGVYALLAAALVTADMLRRGPAAALAGLAVCLPTLWLAPKLLTDGCTIMTPDAPWMYGFRFFRVGDAHDTSLELPFYVVLLSPLALPFLGKLPVRRLLVSQGVMVLVLATMAGWLTHSDFTDHNFHAELQMQQAVEACRWDDALRVAAASKGPVTREMILLRDVALLNKGQLNDTRYTYNNESIPPAVVSDSIQLRISDQAGDLIYYSFGETGFAIRRAIERCMHFGYSYYTLRLLTRCAMVGGEYDNARRYLRLLSRSTFHRAWAEEVQALLNDRKRMAADDRFAVPMRLYDAGNEVVGEDKSLVESTLLKKWMYTDTYDPVAQQYALCCAMQMRDENVFWAQVQRYYVIHEGKPFPRHVQEAMLFYYYELKSAGVNISMIQFDSQVRQRYQAFLDRLTQFSRQGMNEEQLGRALRPEFGDTYMWDYSVLRQIQTN